MDNDTRKILGLTDINLNFPDKNWLSLREIKGVKANLISGTLDYRPRCCEKCGEINQGQIIRNGSANTCTQLPVFNKRLTFLKLKRTRFLCHNCGATFVAHTSLVDEHCHLSKDLKYQIALDLTRTRSRKEIAEDNFVSDVTVIRVQEELAKAYCSNWHFLPKVLCVDEFKSMKSCKGAMSFICVDGESRQLLEVLEDRRLFHLVRHFMRYTRKARLKVRYLVMDMNASYQNLIRQVFPNAELITDRFHIVQQMTRALNQLRVKTMNQFRTSEPEAQKKYRRLKRYWKLLLKDSNDLDTKENYYQPMFKRPMCQQDIVDELLSYDPILHTAYDTVQYLMYYLKEKDVSQFFAQLNHLDSRLPSWFKKKLTFLKGYKQGISNAFSLSYSNGVTEGLNNKIKVIKRVSYGYRNFYHLRDRIYIIQGLIFKQNNKAGAA